jgi:hypothetical protein
VLASGAAVIGRTDDYCILVAILDTSYLLFADGTSGGDYICRNTGDLATLMTTDKRGF